jgi:CheY-like chemotaxis protein
MLLDINMPGMDGFEILSAMRHSETLRAVPVIMCSTSSYDKDIDRAHALNAAGYIVKPFDFAKLKSILDQMPRLHLRDEEDGCVLTCDAA